MPTHLWPSSSLLTVVCLPHCPWTLSHADWSLLLSVVECLSASLFANYFLWRSLAHSTGFSRTCLSSPTSGLVGDLDFKPFVWFRAKTDKGIVCLADHPHSVTIGGSYFDDQENVTGLLQSKVIERFLGCRIKREGRNCNSIFMLKRIV